MELTKEKNPPVGLYVHIPFCDGKCPYCDFYSMRAEEGQYEAYTRRLEELLPRKLEEAGRLVDSVYFGGGTPSLLGGERIGRILNAVQGFLFPQAEITLEANPGRNLENVLDTVRKAGVNRLSLGLQSASELELENLGRRHTAEQAAQAVRAARAAGFSNLSLDLMLAVPGQTRESLRKSIEFCASLDVQHISAYLLKLEPGTSFWNRREELFLPDEEETCELYLLACKKLEDLGYQQYEISNFSRPGKEGRHNLKYWRCEEYLGIGPAAHSFLNGRRFYYPRDLSLFWTEGEPVPDGLGGSPEEFCMLALRLREGLREDRFFRRFGRKLPGSLWKKARLLEKAGYCRTELGRVYLTPEGCLVSNAVIGELTECLEEERTSGIPRNCLEE